jgi:HD-GYP domain-containing protein (c-di-GMP phosphodiesterase class II)
MKIAMDMLCRVFSHALDIIEKEQIGATDYHSMRVAALCAAMGRQLGFDDDTLSALCTCALFHDNALTEYHLYEKKGVQSERNMILHCEKGQSNMSWLPFRKDISGFVLYHHECEGGKGPFKKQEGEFPLEAALIAAADSVDVAYRLQHVPAAGLAVLRGKIAANAGAYSTKTATGILLEILDTCMLEGLRDENISSTLDRSLPRWEVDLSDPSVTRIADFIARIIDFKSRFTRKHTNQIANRAWLMAAHYGYSKEEQAALFLASSLHDIGKIAVPVEVLEKNGFLNDDEFQIIKNHVRFTHDWLCGIPDFETIKNWAANHHEKLDGSGYPFGKPGEGLDFNSRLIACIDIYQAVSEERPYHNARSHAETMPVLYGMAAKNLIDEKIVKDIDTVMAECPPVIEDGKVYA